MLRGEVCLPPNRNVPDGLLPAHNQFPTTLNSSFDQLAYQIGSGLSGYKQAIWFPDGILAKHNYRKECSWGSTSCGSDSTRRTISMPRSPLRFSKPHAFSLRIRRRSTPSTKRYGCLPPSL